MISLKHANRLMTLPIAILCAMGNSAYAADISLAPTPSATSPHQSRQLSAAQLDEATARVQIANSIVNRVSQDADAKGADPNWRRNLMSRLYKLKSAQLRSIEQNATTLDQAHALAGAAHASSGTSSVAPKTLGDVSDDLVYVPTTPCRFIDTRQSGGGGAISTTRDFDTYDTGSEYGGDATCTLPGNGEPAFVANVTVVIAAGAPGYIGIRPYGSTNSTSFLNWGSGGAPSGLANAGIISAAINSSNSNHYEFEVFNGGTTAPQVILDYFGYFESASYPATALSCSLVTNSQSLAANFNGYYYATAACPSGTTAVSPYCYTSSQTGVYASGSGENGGSFCSWINLNSTAVTVTEGQHCCKVPALQ